MPRKDPEARRAYQLDYYERNADRLKRYQSQYRAENADLVATKKQVYRLSHLEESRAGFRRVYVRKQERIREFKAERGCRDCGEDDPRVLQLHHRDPETKNPRLRGRKRISITALSWVDLEAELAKCDVLCSNCHILVTWHEENDGIV